MEILKAIFPNLGKRAPRAGALAALLLLAAAAAPYLPGLRHEFVYDDFGQILENVFLRNPARMKDVLLLHTVGDPTVINGRRPLVLLTYFADRALWGGRPAGYRVTNLLFHVGSVLLLYALARRLGAPPAFAFAAGLVFGLHPALIEAVHVPAFRPDVMYTFFVLAYLLAALALPARAGSARVAAGFGGAALLTLLLALASKEAAVIAPAVLAGVWICFPAVRPVRWVRVAVFGGGVLLAAGWLALGAGSGVQAVGGPPSGLALEFPSNLLTLPWLWANWLRILLWPYPLIVDRVVEPVASAGHWRFLAGAALLAATLLAAAVSIRKRPWVALGLGWMLAGFVPTSNLVPLLNPLAERYLYFTAAGFALLVGWALAPGGLGGGWRRVWRPCLLGMVCAAYLALGLVRMAAWRDGVTLWSRTLRDEPRSARAHTWLGLELKAQGRLGEALWHFEAAEKLNPEDVSAQVNKGILYGQTGDLAAAERILRRAVMQRPDKASAHWNLAVALRLQGQGAEALREIEETLRLDPMHVVALKAKAVLLAETGREREAAECLERVLELDPGDAEARNGLDRWRMESAQESSSREETQEGTRGK